MCGKACAQKLALALLAPLFMLALAEGTLRLSRQGLPVRFLQAFSIAGTPCWVNNPFYGYRFFSPELARSPSPLACARTKPRDVVRIVVLGESATMGDPLIEFGPPRMLEKMLNAAGGPPRFEVINAAMTAINSPVIADIARELRNLQPDVVLIYMGNNEAVGPFGPTSRGRSRLGTRLIPLRVVLTRLHLLQGLKLAMESIVSAGRDPRVFHMDTVGRLALRAEDPRLASMYDLYADRLARIIELAREAGAEVLLSTMAVNLSACPPLGSVNRTDWTDDECQRWADAWAAGIQAQAAGRTEEALAAYRTAAGLDAGHAELAYRLAQTLAAGGHQDEAAKWFVQARDADTRRYRADSRINQIIREQACRHAVRLVDAEADFRATGADAQLFLDHVHFTFEGTYRLAGLWFRELAQDHPGREMPDIEACRRRLFFTARGELRQAEAMAVRYRRDPFTNQLDNAWRQADLAATIQRCRQANAVANLDRLRLQYQEEAARDPADPFLPLQWGSTLLEARRLTEALPLLMNYMERLPRHFEARLMPAFILAKASQPDQAAELLLGAGPPYGWYLSEHALGLIESLLADGFRNEARAFGQAVLDRRTFFVGRRRLTAVVERL